MTVARLSEFVRGVGLAENVDRVAGLEVTPGEGRIGVKREIADRERADPVKNPGRDTFYQVSALR